MADRDVKKGNLAMRAWMRLHWSLLPAATRWLFVAAVCVGAVADVAHPTFLRIIALLITAAAVTWWQRPWQGRHDARRVARLAGIYAGALVATLLLAVVLYIAVIVVLVLAGLALLVAILGGHGGHGGPPRGPAPGEVWLVDYPFAENRAESKQRPALVVARGGGEIAVRKITSQDQSDRADEYEFLPKQPGGLDHDSWMRREPDWLSADLLLHKLCDLPTYAYR
jgi:hypothetical protein